ncbi:hypothetical protein ACHQM5_007123 [Ranunculus cassubicifolius]
MAVSPSPSVTLTIKTEITEPDNPLPPDPSLPLPTSTTSPSLIKSETTNPIPIPSIPPFPSFTPGAIAPSFRPITTTTTAPPQFSPVPNPNVVNPNNYQNPGIQPPGVNVPIMHPGPQLRPMYQMPNNPYGQMQMPNGYSPVPMPMPQGTLPPPGVPRYPAAYTPMVRPVFPPRPPRPPGPMGMLQPMVRPPVPVIRGVPPLSAAAVRPVVPLVAATEKPQTTVYVGKIASTVESDFILSLLRLCGPVKTWKRAQDPSNGTPRGFGFCEFESAEGVLRALRLLSKFSVDGQELVLNVNQATREYLERYVEKKAEREKLKETEADGTKNEEEGAPGVEKNEPSKPPAVEAKVVNASVSTETQDSNQNFGIVSDEDREADRDALDKLQNMLEERLKSKPLPPPPPPPQLPPDVSARPNFEVPSKSRDGDSDIDIFKNGDDKNDDEMTSESKQPNEQDLPDTGSPDRNRKYDRRSRERDRERDLKREKERELVRYEREREREKVRRDREKEQKIREAERVFKERKKEWESRERDREHQRKHEAEKDKERRLERKRLILDQEDESDDEDRKRRRRGSVLEEKRKRRKREKDEDMDDRLREEEEIADAKKREIEEMERKKEEEANKHVSSSPLMNGIEVHGAQQSNENDSTIVTQPGDIIMKNGIGDDSVMPTADAKQSSNSAPTRKLGFGLVGSGKRTAVPSVFHEEDEDDENKDKKMRPLVPIDYSTEELQAVQTPTSETPPPHLAAAAEFAKRISNVNPKDEERERDRHSSRRHRHEEDRHRSRDRDEERHRSRDEHRERDHVPDNKQVKTQENKKLLDAKQLIDMIPKTKEELFSFEINWAVYDKHELHERMRPWISKKITEFLGEEETTLVDYIVSKTKEHVKASEMLELLQAILDDEAEMFVLKMWRMLIFEIKKVETGLAVKPKA